MAAVAVVITVPGGRADARPAYRCDVGCDFLTLTLTLTLTLSLTLTLTLGPPTGATSAVTS